MTPKEALALIDAILAKAVGSRKDHQDIEEALDVLEVAIEL